MTNGKVRDRWLTDIVFHDIPTVSPLADDLTNRVLRLASDKQLRQLDDEVYDRIVASSESKRWVLQTERPLFDFDPATAVAIERYLADWLDRLQRDAQERGWEV
jgi:hypothetical protein